MEIKYGMTVITRFLLSLNNSYGVDGSFSLFNLLYKDLFETAGNRTGFFILVCLGAR